MDSLEPLLTRSAALAEKVAALFDDASFDGSPRGQAALAMCDIAVEHATSLKLLIAAGLPTSAVAMLRLQYEALLRATWLWHSAADHHIGRLQAPLTLESEHAATNLRSVSDMLTDLTNNGPRGAGRLLTRFRDRLWSGLNSFVHGGIHPLRRKCDGYPSVLIADLIKSSNAVTFLTAIVMAELAGDAKIAERYVALNAGFADCVPAPEPFPDD